MTEKKTLILPEFERKVSKKARKINLPVKNWLMYGVRILSINVKPIKVKIKSRDNRTGKIKKKKSNKYLIPIFLQSIEHVNEIEIQKLKDSDTQIHYNYTMIDNFGVDKTCNWSIAPSHYNILKAWIERNEIGIDETFYFTRIGKGVNSKLIFLTEKQMKDYMKENKKGLDDKEKK